MKRTLSIFVIMAFVVAALCLVSCEGTTPVVGEEQTISGRWKCVFTTSDTPPEGVLLRIQKGDMITFYGVSRYELVHSDGGLETGKCEKRGNTLRFIPDFQQAYFDFSCDVDFVSMHLVYQSNYIIRLERFYAD